MEGKSLTILVISALLMLTLLAGCAPSQTGEAEVQKGQEAQEEQKVQEEEEMQEEQEVQEEQKVQEEEEMQEEQEVQEEQKVQEEQEMQSIEFLQGGERINNVENAYFYKPDETVHTYEGYFYLHSYTDLWKDVDLYITKLESFSDGTLYTLELEQPETSDPLDELYDHKHIGYFYVMDEIIYRYIDYPTGEGGYTDENTDRIIKWIKSDEAGFLEQSTIVCCEEGTEDITDENGYHSYVEVEGDRRIYRFYNDYFYGSKDYMLMVWEKGKGLTYYMHGRGGMDMHVEFGHNIKEEQKTDYGYPYKLFH